MKEKNEFDLAHEYFKKIFLEKKKKDQSIKDFPEINKLIIQTSNYIWDRKAKKCVEKI